jgi:hypothetical protein
VHFKSSVANWLARPLPNTKRAVLPLKNVIRFRLRPTVPFLHYDDDKAVVARTEIDALDDPGRRRFHSLSCPESVTYLITCLNVIAGFHRRTAGRVDVETDFAHSITLGNGSILRRLAIFFDKSVLS